MATPTHQSINLTRSSPFGVIDSSRQGMLRTQVDAVASLVGLTDRVMAYALNITSRHLHRLREEQRVSVDASDWPEFIVIRMTNHVEQ